MTVQVSTKFKERILGPESFMDIFEQGRILIYSGVQPTTADHAVTGTLLAQITLQGEPWLAGGSAGGLVWEQAGVWVGKPSAAQWRFEGQDTGVAAWFRIVGSAVDGGGLSYSAPRIDGAVGDTLETDFFLATLAITPSTSLEIQQFNFTLPPI